MPSSRGRSFPENSAHDTKFRNELLPLPQPPQRGEGRGGNGRCCQFRQLLAAPATAALRKRTQKSWRSWTAATVRRARILSCLGRSTLVEAVTWEAAGR